MRKPHSDVVPERQPHRCHARGDPSCPRRPSHCTQGIALFEVNRDLGAELLQAIREMKAGQVQVVHSLVTEAREKTGLSQSPFAALLADAGIQNR